MENVGYNVYRRLIDSSLNRVFNGIPLKKWSEHKEETGKCTAFLWVHSTLLVPDSLVQQIPMETKVKEVVSVPDRFDNPMPENTFIQLM